MVPAWWRSRTIYGIGAAVVVALLAAAGWFYKSGGQGEAIDSLAVLPFVNASGDPNAEYLSDGISESLINSLSQLPHLKVMSAGLRSFMYKRRGTPTLELWGAGTGRSRGSPKAHVTKHGDDLEISAELVDARDDSHIWGQQYSRKSSDIFALQGEIAKEMTTALRMRLTGEDEKRMAKTFTVDPEAYQDYLKGRFWWNKRNEEGYKKGIEYFQQAISKDPTYALAYSGLADCYTLLGVNGYVSPKEVSPKAKQAALKALEIDDSLAEAHTSLGFIKTFFDWDWSGGDQEFRRAIELNPSYATARQWYSVPLSETGRSEESIAQARRALELDPLSIVTNWDLGYVFYLQRQNDQAIEQLRKTLELDPNFLLAHRDLGYSYVQKSMYQEAAAEFEKAVEISPNNATALSGLGYAYAKAGRTAEAQKALDQLIELTKQKYVPELDVAVVYVGLGKKDKAFEWLEKGFQQRSGTHYYSRPSLRRFAAGPTLRRPSPPDEPAAVAPPSEPLNRKSQCRIHATLAQSKTAFPGA